MTARDFTNVNDDNIVNTSLLRDASELGGH